MRRGRGLMPNEALAEEVEDDEWEEAETEPASAPDSYRRKARKTFYGSIFGFGKKKNPKELRARPLRGGDQKREDEGDIESEGGIEGEGSIEDGAGVEDGGGIEDGDETPSKPNPKISAAPAWRPPSAGSGAAHPAGSSKETSIPSAALAPPARSEAAAIVGKHLALHARSKAAWSLYRYPVGDPSSFDAPPVTTASARAKGSDALYRMAHLIDDGEAADSLQNLPPDIDDGPYLDISARAMGEDVDGPYSDDLWPPSARLRAIHEIHDNQLGRDEKQHENEKDRYNQIVREVDALKLQHGVRNNPFVTRSTYRWRYIITEAEQLLRDRFSSRIVEDDSLWIFTEVDGDNATSSHPSLAEVEEFLKATGEDVDLHAAIKVAFPIPADWLDTKKHGKEVVLTELAEIYSAKRGGHGLQRAVESLLRLRRDAYFDVYDFLHFGGFSEDLVRKKLRWLKETGGAAMGTWNGWPAMENLVKAANDWKDYTPWPELAALGGADRDALFKLLVAREITRAYGDDGALARVSVFTGNLENRLLFVTDTTDNYNEAFELVFGFAVSLALKETQRRHLRLVTQSPGRPPAYTAPSHMASERLVTDDRLRPHFSELAASILLRNRLMHHDHTFYQKNVSMRRLNLQIEHLVGALQRLLGDTPRFTLPAFYG